MAQSIHKADGCLIAVMGPTGSGKSSFIRGITGHDVKVGHSLLSETAKVETFDFRIGSQVITLADTPGFDDTYTSDTDTLRTIARWLKDNYESGRLLNGLLYLQPITKNRLEGSMLRSLSLLEKVVGASNIKNVVLVTTFWNKITVEVGQDRERQLAEIDGFWRALREKGARVERMAQDYTRFSDVLTSMSAQPKMTLQIQSEMKAGLALEETMAGLALEDELNMLKREQEAKQAYARIMHEKKLARQRELAEQKRSYEAQERERIEQEEHDQLVREQAEREQEMQQAEIAQKRQIRLREDQLAQQARKEAAREAELQAQRLAEEKRTIRKQREQRAKDDYEVALLQAKRIRNDRDSVEVAAKAGLIKIKCDLFDDRSGMNHFCDRCRRALGDSKYIVCDRCPEVGQCLYICGECWDTDIVSCMDQDHYPLTEVIPPKSGCQRGKRWKYLKCDLCKRKLEGLYFHCCKCCKDQFDICLKCVLRGKGCSKSSHRLKWGIEKVTLSLGTISSTSAQRLFPWQPKFAWSRTE